MIDMYAVRITYRNGQGCKTSIVRHTTEQKARDHVEAVQTRGSKWGHGYPRATYIGKVKVAVGKVGNGRTNHDPKKRSRSRHR